jgi:hypothetical protein
LRSHVANVAASFLLGFCCSGSGGDKEDVFTSSFSFPWERYLGSKDRPLAWIHSTAGSERESFENRVLAVRDLCSWQLHVGMRAGDLRSVLGLATWLDDCSVTRASDIVGGHELLPRAGQQFVVSLFESANVREEEVESFLVLNLIGLPKDFPAERVKAFLRGETPMGEVCLHSYEFSVCRGADQMALIFFETHVAVEIETAGIHVKAEANYDALARVIGGRSEADPAGVAVKKAWPRVDRAEQNAQRDDVPSRGD